MIKKKKKPKTKRQRSKPFVNWFNTKAPFPGETYPQLCTVESTVVFVNDAPACVVIQASRENDSRFLFLTVNEAQWLRRRLDIFIENAKRRRKKKRARP